MLQKFICILMIFGFLSCPLNVFSQNAEKTVEPIEVVESRVGFYGGTRGALIASTSDSFVRAFSITYTGNMVWGSAGINLISPKDISKFKSIVIRAKGTKGAKFVLNFRSQEWRLYDVVQSGTKALPSKGLTPEFQDIVIDIQKDIMDRAGKLDPTSIIQLAFEVGKASTDNKSGVEVIIDGVFFVK